MKRSIIFSNKKIYNLANSDKLSINRCSVELATTRDMNDYGLDVFLDYSSKDPFFNHYVIPEHMISIITLKKEV